VLSVALKILLQFQKCISLIINVIVVAMTNGYEVNLARIKQRQIANLEILKILNTVVNRFPDLRFTQILTILNLDKDLFYQESVDTLEHIKKQLEGKLSL
jgi:hypothetical protein